MKYTLIQTKKFEKSLKRIQRSGKHLRALQGLRTVVYELACGNQLAEKYQDHALQGQLRQYRECHIGGDVLLIYQIREEELILVLIDFGSHSYLFA